MRVPGDEALESRSPHVEPRLGSLVTRESTGLGEKGRVSLTLDKPFP